MGRFSGNPEFRLAPDETGLGALLPCLETLPGLNGNRFRPYTSRSCASAFNFKAVSRIMPKQPFGHLAAS
jgi:hypothetical protein